MFPSGRGTYLQRSNFSRLVWRPAVQRLGLDGLRFHDLRHTAATLAAAAGATTKELMERMGHTSPVVALRYQHVMQIDRLLWQAPWTYLRPIRSRSGRIRMIPPSRMKG